MARNKKQDGTLVEGVNTLRKTVSNVNEQAFQTTENVVTGVLKASGQWQDVLAKALQNGTKLYGEQQNFVLRTLENVKTQAGKDLTRLQKLVGLDSPRAKKIVADVTARAKAEAERVDELVEEVKTTANERTRKVVSEITKVADKVAKRTKTEIKEVKEDLEEVVDQVQTEVNEFAAAIVPQNLKVIEGIGPKLEGILKESGINTYQDIIKTPIAELKEIIQKAGPRYKSYDPSKWAEQALLAAEGKKDALEALKAKIKSVKAK